MAYVVPGFPGREPWKNADLASFGVMKAMAAGQTAWWHPSVLGYPAETPAWLPYWLGALFIQVFPAFPELASRIPFLAALVLTLFFTWNAVYRFALLPGAQPVVFAFGGQAHPVDYARALADSGLMALMACLGLAQLSHEATPSVFQAMSIAALLHASALFSHPKKASNAVAMSCWLGGLLSLGLSGQPLLATVIGGALPLLLSRLHRTRALFANGSQGQESGLWTSTWATWSIGTVLALASLALLIGIAEAPHQTPNIGDGVSFVRLLVWFTWPVWPLGLWTAWRWRKHFHHSHLAIPLLFSGLIAFASLSQDGSDRVLLLALPAMSVLAAFALPTLRRSVSALIDWFSVLFFSASALIIWIIWVAMLTGYPTKPASNVIRLAPGFKAEFEGISFSLAVIATVAWLLVVAWRLGRHQAAIWKSMVLPATGGALCWLLLMTLWLPLLDYGRSYGPIARRIATLIPPGSCVHIQGLSQAQIVGLMHHGHLDLRRWTREQGCPTLVTSPENRPTVEQAGSSWKFQARVNRLNDRRESLLLFTRVPAIENVDPVPGQQTREEDEPDPTETAM